MNKWLTIFVIMGSSFGAIADTVSDIQTLGLAQFDCRMEGSTQGEPQQQQIGVQHYVFAKDEADAVKTMLNRTDSVYLDQLIARNIALSDGNKHKIVIEKLSCKLTIGVAGAK